MEPTSPELVLVSSAEDRRRAIEQMPPLPWELVQAQAPRIPPSYPRIVIEDVPEDVYDEPTRRRISGGMIAAVVVLAAVGAVGYLSETRWHEERPTLAAVPMSVATTTRAVQPTLSVAAEQQVPPAPPTAPAQTTPPAQTQTQATTPAVTRPAKPLAPTVAPRTVTEAKPTSPPPPTGFVPARTWAWVPSKGAASYDVTFYLDDRVVLRAQPTDARLVLPPSFRYRAGRYRWTVHAKPSGASVVDSSFVLSAAAAAAANGS